MAKLAPHGIVAIGASAGGVGALRRLAAGLPPAFPWAIAIVLHVGRHESILPELLSAAGPLPARHAEDGEALRPGHIHVAPPDHHLVVEPGRLRLVRGPAENNARPAIDPLFRSAAAAYGPAAIGVVLSGELGDGAAGLIAVKRRGGIAVVQDPADAEFPSMPRTALRHAGADHCVAVAAMPALLAGLARPQAPASAAGGKEGEMSAGYTLSAPHALTCPTCGGAVRETRENGLTYFVCHIGHHFAAEDMAAAQRTELERALEVALRALNERAALCDRLAEGARGRRSHAAERWQESAAEARAGAEVLRRFLEERPGTPRVGAGGTP